MTEQLALPLERPAPVPATAAPPAVTAPIGGRPRVDGAIIQYLREFARRRMNHAFPGIDAKLVFEELREPDPTPGAWATMYRALDELVEDGELRELAIGGVYVTTEAADG